MLPKVIRKSCTKKKSPKKGLPQPFIEGIRKKLVLVTSLTSTPIGSPSIKSVTCFFLNTYLPRRHLLIHVKKRYCQTRAWVFNLGRCFFQGWPCPPLLRTNRKLIHLSNLPPGSYVRANIAFRVDATFNYGLQPSGGHSNVKNKNKTPLWLVAPGSKIKTK